MANSTPLHEELLPTDSKKVRTHKISFIIGRLQGYTATPYLYIIMNTQALIALQVGSRKRHCLCCPLSSSKHQDELEKPLQ